MMILPLRRQFEDKAEVLITHRLPGPGKVVVRVGDKVSDQDTVGVAEVSGGEKRIDLAKIMGISTERVQSVLIKKPGEAIYLGEPLARLRRTLGLRNKVYLSPVDGILDDVAGGEVTIRFAPSEVSVTAEFAGTVALVNEGESVTIRLTASRVLGLYGTGPQRFGEIKIVHSTTGLITAQDIDSSLAGKIVVSRSALSAEAVVKGLAIGVRSYFVGGVNFHDSLNFQGKSDLTIVSLEGYGEHQIREEIWKVLSAQDGRCAAIYGDAKLLIIPTDGKGSARDPVGWRELHAGDRVRVTSGEDLGTVGTANGVSSDSVVLPSGISTEVVKIKTQGEDLVYPAANLEIIEPK